MSNLSRRSALTVITAAGAVPAGVAAAACAAPDPIIAAIAEHEAACRQEFQWCRRNDELEELIPAMMAESYARATPWALTDKAEKPQRDDPYGAHKLNDIISDAIDRASSEKKDFEATKEQRAKLKELFPTLSFDEAMKTIARIDRDMHRDPLTTGAQVAAMFGMAITPLGMAAQQGTNSLASQIEQVIPTLPNFDGDAVVKVINHPRFGRSGDKIADLRRAYEVTQAVYRHGMTVDSALRQL